MTRLAFVVPAWRRFELAEVCLTQLARTCLELRKHGLQATAVVVADDANLEVAAGLGFATVEQENFPFGRKWNDGIEYACRYLAADFVVPCGTDNFVDARLVARLPRPGTIGAHRLITLVHESGDRLVTLRVSYDGGDGIRVIPAGMLETLGYRPADDDRSRAIDTSIWNRIGRALGRRPEFDYRDVHPLQVIGFQSEDVQLNDYRSLRALFSTGDEQRGGVWETLESRYPRAAVNAARKVYEARAAAAEAARPRPSVVVAL